MTLSAGQLVTEIVGLSRGDNKPNAIVITSTIVIPAATSPELDIIHRMDSKERARVLLNLRIQEKRGTAKPLSQLQSLQYQTARSSIENIR
jgi:hypothetical protein